MSSRTTSSSTISEVVAPLELSQHENLHWAASDHQTSNNLRHKTEYKHIKILGAGAYGTTHLVRNVVDQKLYALKCIKLEERLTNNDNGSNSCGEDETKTLSSSNKVLREVEALSSLRSDNVVRYYACWVERGDINNENEEDRSNGNNDSSFSSELFDDKSTDNTSTRHKNTEETCNICSQQYTDWYVSYEQWGLIDAVLQPLNLCTTCYKKSLPSQYISSVDIRKKHILPQYLYILMEYGGRTLSDVMKEIPDNDDTLRWSLFAQCVQGLYSIHEQNFYHRDIKPGNIFVQDDIAQIGDLGLSIDSEIDSTVSVGESSAAAGVGTFLYSAPEVEDGGMFSEKSDVYSFGIVLIELFSNFNTVMERVSVLSNIREGGTLPEEWQLDTDQAVLARSMVDQNPSNRPSAREILQQLVQKGVIADPDKSLLLDMIEQLQIMVHEKDAEVKRLRRLLDDNGIAADTLI